jgi:hypothetical protein
MEEAGIRGSTLVYFASEFAKLPLTEREQLRENLVCMSCGADAYFVREARNGRRACFGARPHGEACELASFVTDDGGSGKLDETDERINAGDVFRIEPDKPRKIKHVKHDPEGAASESTMALRYTRRGGRSVRTSSMNLGRLLRQLVLRPEFRRSSTLLILSDDSKQTVRSGCVHLREIEAKHLNRHRVYWGVLRYPRPREDGGAWLNTGFGSPTVAISPSALEELMVTAGVEDLDDLAGSFFAYMGKLKRGQSGRRFFFADSAANLAVRLFDEDEEIN